MKITGKRLVSYTTLNSFSHLVTRKFSSSALRRAAGPSPNTGLQLDPSLQQLLRDTDLSLLKSRKNRSKIKYQYISPKKLEALPISEDDAEAWEGYTIEEDAEEANQVDAWHNRSEKRSPEASFGIKHIGSISIPARLEEAMVTLIDRSDKHQLRSDAKRLFLKPNARTSSRYDNEWTPELPDKFKGPKRYKASRVTPREALTFAVIAMPSQYAAIVNVLTETRRRLGDEWAKNVSGFIDFGSGTGSTIWAALDVFRKREEGNPLSSSVEQEVATEEPDSSQDQVKNDSEEKDSLDPEQLDNPLANSSISHYLCLENRPGLLATSKKLTQGLSMGSTKLQVEKFWGKDGHEMASDPRNTVAVAAFTLSELPTDTTRRMMLREMWNTGAETMIIIDHGTEEGFKIVADAREYLLLKGRKAVAAHPGTLEVTEDIEADSNGTLGSHVIAPCPHDGTCPMTLEFFKNSAPNICHFSQRLTRPKFLRLTKHASKGHEDVQYSYVVIQRGLRPTPPASLWDPVVKPHISAHRNKGKRVLVEVAKDAGIGDRTLEPESEPVNVIHLDWKRQADTNADLRRRDRHWVSNAPPRPDEDIRAESFYWPRVIYPPMKRSGHVILDTCTKEGNIARHTIPRSQGKQPYYDARKASWGDSFPWESKNGADIRRRGSQAVNDPAASEADQDDDDEGFTEGMMGDYDVYVDEEGRMTLKKSA